VYVELYSDEMVNYTGFLIDRYATGEKLIGNAFYGSIAPGEYVSVEVSLGNVLAGLHYYRVVTSTPGEVATLTTGGTANDVLTTTLYIDTAAPELKGMNIAGKVVNDRSPEIEVEWHDTIYSGFSDAIVKIDGIEIAAEVEAIGNEGTVRAKVPFLLADGEHVVEVTLVDNGGNDVTETWSFTVDATPPTVSIVEPVGMIVPLTYDSELEIKGMTEPGAAVTINGNPVSVDSSGMFDVTVTLQRGENIFYITATDAAGNTGFAVVSALYLPDLPQLWEEIGKLSDELSDIQGEIEQLQGMLGELQGNVSALENRLNELKAALEENVSALNEAIENGDAELLEKINDNVATLKGQTEQLQEDLNTELSDVKDKNAKQDDEIGGAKNIGYVGIVLAIIALIIGILALAIKGKKKEERELSEHPQENNPEE